MIDNSNTDLGSRLIGRTLEVYLYLQKCKKAAGIREVQRELNLSSPSVAEYQIEKLLKMGIAERDGHGRVFITKRVKVKALDSYVDFGRFHVPRLALYAAVFTAIALLYFFFNFRNLSMYGAALPIAAAGIFWIEAWKLRIHNMLARSTKDSGEKDYFWVSLAPGLAAIAVFFAGILFLFYYVEPNGLILLTPPPADPAALPFQSDPESLMPLPTDVAFPLKENNAALFLKDFATMQISTLLFIGTIVTGFLVYLMMMYRCERNVLVQEQGCRQLFET